MKNTTFEVPDHAGSAEDEDGRAQTPNRESAQIIPFPKAQPAWMQGEADYYDLHDGDDDTPQHTSMPLDYHTREDRHSTEALDYPGAVSRVTFDDLVDGFEDVEACKRLFGVSMLDNDLEEALLASIRQFDHCTRDPAATLCGTFVATMIVFLHKHPAFQRNIGGPVRRLTGNNG
ncbi:hypothetical protein [Tardiphaga sp.]|jgi:hypothetical protein|uniref:hypothetical protein n=1 Tax=Tardiphaga sp. TaxID=1926292 RepID=UPI0037DA65C5